MEDNKIIQYHCPEFYHGQRIYKFLIDLYELHPQYFYDNVQINCIFGSFPSMIWNGGGVFNDEKIVNIEELKRIKNFYEGLSIPLKLNLTNPLLTKNDCYDRYCNKVVEIFENGINQILISSPILEEYLRKNFSGYKYCKSIIASEKDFDFEAELANYEYIVLPRRKNKDFDFLKSIKEENRDRFEILCNDPCPIDCNRLYSHYNDFAKVTLYEKAGSDIMDCTGIKENDLRWNQFSEDQIFYTDINNKYLELGYHHFKLAGRGSALNMLHGILNYFIKTEYLYEIIFQCLYVYGYEK